jgi:5'-3' exonuclease
MKLLCVDGSSLLSTSFYGNVPNEYLRAKTDAEREEALKKVLQTKDGQYTNGVFTMMKTLEKIISKQKPTHLVVAWDLNRNTFRRSLYSEYKAQRAETRPELKSQFGLAQEVLRAMNIKQYIIDGYEADDIIGTFAKKFKEQIPVYIYTKDQDALQLVEERVRLWLITSKAKEMYDELGIDVKSLNIPDNVFEYTPLYVKEFYGIEPQQIVDLKALIGDSSDNIPGVKGVGEKTVVPLLQEFKTVEGIYEYIENTPEKEIKAFFKELGITRSPLSYLMKTSDTELVGKASALLSKQLATICCDVPDLQDVLLEELHLQIDMEGRKKIYEKLEFKSLLGK